MTEAATTEHVFPPHRWTGPTKHVGYDHCAACGTAKDAPDLQFRPCLAAGAREIPGAVLDSLPQETRDALTSIAPAGRATEPGYCRRCRGITDDRAKPFCIECATTALVGTIAILGERLLDGQDDVELAGYPDDEIDDDETAGVGHVGEPGDPPPPPAEG